MINQMTIAHFIGSVLQTLASLERLHSDGEFHAFSGANSVTTGYYRMTPDNKGCSITVDYFHGHYEGSATISFLIDQVEAPHHAN